MVKHRDLSATGGNANKSSFLFCMLTVSEGKPPALQDVTMVNECLWPFYPFIITHERWSRLSKRVNEIFDFTESKTKPLIPPPVCGKSYIASSHQINHRMWCVSPLCMMGVLTSHQGKVWNNNQVEITQCHENKCGKYKWKHLYFASEQRNLIK